jgi:hypothetical protein
MDKLVTSSATLVESSFAKGEETRHRSFGTISSSLLCTTVVEEVAEEEKKISACKPL